MSPCCSHDPSDRCGLVNLLRKKTKNKAKQLKTTKNQSKSQAKNRANHPAPSDLIRRIIRFHFMALHRVSWLRKEDSASPPMASRRTIVWPNDRSAPRTMCTDDSSRSHLLRRQPRSTPSRRELLVSQRLIA